MKSMLARALGLALVAMAAGLGNSLQAQTPGQPGMTPTVAVQQTRVATLNIAVVTKGYKKFEVFTKEMQDLERPFMEKAKTLADRYKQWEEVARTPTTKDEDRDKAQKYLVDLKRMLEDNQGAAAKALSSRRNEKLVQLYREIQDAASKYALQNGIHVVLQYYEPLNETDIFIPANIDRKLKSSGAGAFTPLYIASGVDISQDIVRALNAPIQAAASAAGIPAAH